MRIAVLSTDTAHHRYFLRRFLAEAPVGVDVPLVLFETRTYPWRQKRNRHFTDRIPDLWHGAVLNPYVFPGIFSSAQRAYEARRFFPDGDSSLPIGPRVVYVDDANGPAARELLAGAKADIGFVYGTGRLRRETYDLPGLGSINAHGGLLPNYRGLDTNLWAAYEGEPDRMAVTLHRVVDRLDEGAVLDERFLTPDPDICVPTLRFFTARLCTDMFLAITRSLLNGNLVGSERDNRLGRYYGPMPALLKIKTNRILKQWAGQEPGPGHATVTGA